MFTMLASRADMKAPMSTVPSTYQWKCLLCEIPLSGVSMVLPPALNPLFRVFFAPERPAVQWTRSRPNGVTGNTR